MITGSIEPLITASKFSAARYSDGMFHPTQRRELARQYHKQLPAEMRQYLNGRGIPDWLIDQKQLGWSGHRIVIPVFDSKGDICQFRYAKSPNDQTESPKMLTEIATGAQLYGWERLAEKPRRIVICEGEFDRLVLEAHGFPAVTSTAGAQSFQREWALAFDGIRHVYACFDNDASGEAGARLVKSLLPAAKIVRLPAEVGEKGDVTDYFVRLGHGRTDFEVLLSLAATEAEQADGEVAPTKAAKPPPPPSSRPHERAQHLKQAIRLVRLAGRYVDFHNVGGTFVGRCPFHEDDHPSFTVYPDSNTYYCFGCGKHGDIITFVMHKESKTYDEALDALERFEILP